MLQNEIEILKEIYIYIFWCISSGYIIIYMCIFSGYIIIYIYIYIYIYYNISEKIHQNTEELRLA